jgi:hypothetical protein
VHELSGMVRDGWLAKVIQKNLPVLTNSHTFQSVRQVMSDVSFSACVAEARETDQARHAA